MGARAGVCLRGDDDFWDDDERSPVTQKNCSASAVELWRYPLFRAAEWPGGWIQNGAVPRVNGDLSLSRALGDLEYKDETLPPESHIVTRRCVMSLWPWHAMAVQPQFLRSVPREERLGRVSAAGVRRGLGRCEFSERRGLRTAAAGRPTAVAAPHRYGDAAAFGHLAAAVPRLQNVRAKEVWFHRFSFNAQYRQRMPETSRLMGKNARKQKCERQLERT
eukprot:Skav227261  [mRNA]  locus=scaffold3417:34959:51944:- [translate_table: standard]